MPTRTEASCSQDSIREITNADFLNSLWAAGQLLPGFPLLHSPFAFSGFFDLSPREPSFLSIPGSSCSLMPSLPQRRKSESSPYMGPTLGQRVVLLGPDSPSGPRGEHHEQSFWKIVQHRGRKARGIHLADAWCLRTRHVCF